RVALLRGDRRPGRAAYRAAAGRAGPQRVPAVRGGAGHARRGGGPAGPRRPAPGGAAHDGRRHRRPAAGAGDPDRRGAGGEMSREGIGFMGGTFDPFHHGDLLAASVVADRFGLTEVVFVPTGQPWQKNAVTAAEGRYLMTVIATASNPRFQVSRVDIDR